MKELFKRFITWFKNVNKIKEKDNREHFNYIIVTEDGNCIGGTDSFELAKALCDIVAESKEERFYIYDDFGKMHIYCQDIEENAEQRKIYRMIAHPTEAPYIPLEKDRLGC